jgi:hypothetical protein
MAHGIFSRTLKECYTEDKAADIYIGLDLPSDKRNKERRGLPTSSKADCGTIKDFPIADHRSTESI